MCGSRAPRSGGSCLEASASKPNPYPIPNPNLNPLILALAPAPTPTLPPTRWDLPRLYALAGSMCLVVTAAQLLFLGIGFAAMRPAAQQPDRLNLFWYVRRTNPNP